MSMSLGARYLCDDCGRDRSGDAPLSACRCGSSSRRRVDVTDAFRRPASDDAPPWHPFKDWSAKYLQLLWNVTQLRRLYAPDSAAPAAEVGRIVETTFTACVDLADWLTSGPEPWAVTPGDATRLLAAEPLSVCVALLGRGEGGSTARIVPVSFVRPPHFWVELRRPGVLPVRFDALDLADRCLLTWQRFLTARGVSLPSW